MIILAIETSCDETAAALVKDGIQLLASSVATSLDLHRETGGIVPEVAARQQVTAMIPTLDRTLKAAKVPITQIDALAVTYGPGLIGSLLVGVETAKTLAWAWEKPLIPVNHLIAHLYANWLVEGFAEAIKFPALGLEVSGGYTELMLLRGHGQIDYLGGTRDDAAGEAFDKVARLLGLGYPGGPEIEKLSNQITKTDQGKNWGKLFPRPMVNDPGFDFSFSGLKVAVRRVVEEGKLSRERIAYEFQEASTEVLVKKTIRAAKKYQAKSILLAGGVAANTRLREELTTQAKHLNIPLFVPPIKLCTDNAAFIAAYAHFNYHPVPPEEVTANPDLSLEVSLEKWPGETNG